MPDFRPFLTAVLLAAVTGLAQAADDAWDVANPPGDWRSIEIDTRETTWSNVTVSPDGETIVFDALGDIYSVPMAGGEARALTEGIPWNYQPRFSPDGLSIAFVSDRGGADNLWVMDADGTNARPVSDEHEHLVHNPAWSPNGQYLVAKKSFMGSRSIAGGEIWMFHAGAKGKGLQLTERPHGDEDQKNQADPVFSADGRYVYFAQDTTAGRVWQYGKDSTGQIFVIQRYDRETGETREFVTGPGGAVRPAPSPDGRWLAFIKRLVDLRSAIYLKDLETGREFMLHDDFERDLQETSGTEGNAPSIEWTPDSSAIVFWSGGGLHRVDVESREVTAVPVRLRKSMWVRDTLRHEVDVAPDRFTVQMPRWPVVSPDGETVVFQALGVLWKRQLPDGEPVRLTTQGTHFEFYPAFSPTGDQLVYTTWSDMDQGSVRVLDLADGTETVLTPNPGNYVEPAFSADGQSVAYRQMGGGYLLSPLWSLEPGLYVVPADAAQAPRHLVSGGSWPRFSADGARVWFQAQADGGLALKSVDLSGQDERIHARGSDIAAMALSPDGQWLAFIEGYEAYLAPLPMTGKPVTLSGSSKAYPVRQLSARAGAFLAWQGNDTVTWSLGPVLYRRALGEAFAFVEGASTPLPEPLERGTDIGFQVDADIPDGTVYLVGGTVVTMRDAMAGTQEIIEDGVVAVSGNRIVAVGARSDVSIAEDQRVIDVSGKTILPGFIDAHAHGGMARDGITPQQNWMQYSNLAFGVTTIHDPSNDTTEIFAASEMQRAGRLVAPRIFSTGTILYGAKGIGYHVDVESLEDAQFHVSRLKQAGAVSVKSYQLPRRDSRQMIVEAGDELGVMVVPEGGMKFQHNMTEIVDGHTTIEHSMTLKHIYDDVLQLWSQTGTAYTPTLGVSFGGMEGERYWYDRTNVWENERLMRYTPKSRVEPRAIRRQTAPDSHYNHIHVAASAKQLMDRGVAVNTGAHGQREGLALHWEMWMLEQGGFTPWQALRAATASGAWSLGMDGEIGSIESGKLADLVIIDGNPLDDLRRSEYVHATMINGRLFEAETMNQVWPAAVKRQPFFWELEGGDTVHPSAAAAEHSHSRRH
ncbi:amidohydrolase family protein [Marinihelvus fidelis]|uniref:Amidohydrolase family protein n=1 Tax=Marinihelvus fidelis TaxID=2613842 RepID=A0A5N0T777_9GAMM|nr:amidohydrolase family protein [Marinihelvus fidelis]KAA9130905.1 amidohydrolase family protein [Marinihelvus fidelis]